MDTNLVLQYPHKKYILNFVNVKIGACLHKCMHAFSQLITRNDFSSRTFVCNFPDHSFLLMPLLIPPPICCDVGWQPPVILAAEALYSPSFYFFRSSICCCFGFYYFDFLNHFAWMELPAMIYVLAMILLFVDHSINPFWQKTLFLYVFVCYFQRISTQKTEKCDKKNKKKNEPNRKNSFQSQPKWMYTEHLWWQIL